MSSRPRRSRSFAAPQSVRRSLLARAASASLRAGRDRSGCRGLAASAVSSMMEDVTVRAIQPTKPSLFVEPVMAEPQLRQEPPKTFIPPEPGEGAYPAHATSR